MSLPERSERRLEPRHRVTTFVIGVVMTSVIAGLATLLFSAFHFQQTAPFGVLGNLLAMPIVTFVMMPSALFATLSIPFGLDAPLFYVMGWSIDTVIGCAGFVRAVSGGFDPSPILAPMSLLIGLLAIAWLAFFETPVRLVGPVLAVPLVIAFGLERAPDILIADTTQALAVRDNDTLALMAGRANTFATNVWSERYMEPVGAMEADARCDAIGCINVSDLGFTLAYVTNFAAFSEDCMTADLVVSRISAPSACSNHTTVIDRGDLGRLGPHMLYWDPQARTFTIKTSITDPGRPWRISGQ